MNAMKQVLIVTALVCLSTAGCSKLEKLSVEPEGGTSYLELETIKRVVGDEEAFMIVDLPAPMGPVQSMKYKVLVDCKENVTEIMAFYAFPERMGQGNALVLFGKSEDDMLYRAHDPNATSFHDAHIDYPHHPEPGSTGAKLRSIVCTTPVTPVSLKNQAMSFLGLYVDPNDKG